MNRERLAATFTTLCEISSPSRQERAVADHITQIFSELGADSIHEDNSARQTGSDSGNLIIKFNGTNSSSEPILFACHMDTVTPADNVKVQRTGDTFTSAGETVLGADDKSGIAAIIETVQTLKETGTPHNPLELLFTTCEEIGLRGAKALDHSKLQAKYGYAIDSRDTNSAIIKAPGANTIEINIHGLAAHAGLNPERGINAFSVAARAVSNLKIGRLDEESTSNLGVIEGGIARNIVPDLLTIKGEVRSHSLEKLKAYTEDLCNTFNAAVSEWENPAAINTARPSVDFTVNREYDPLSLSPDSPAVEHLRCASKRSGKSLEMTATGGGSDANVLVQYGIDVAILGSGMQKVHTVDEFIELDDMAAVTELLYQLATTPNSDT